MTFGEIKNAVEKYLYGENTAPTDVRALIPGWINKSLEELEIGNNFNGMKVESETDVATSDTYLSIPDTKYKETVALLVKDEENSYLVQKKDTVTIFEKIGKNEKRRPDCFCYIPDRKAFLLYPIPDKAYHYHILYYRYSSPLTLDTDKNWATEKLSEVLIYKSVIKAKLYVGDKDVEWLMVEADRALQQFLQAEEKEEFAGSICNTLPPVSPNMVV